ncbi:hypothetical protein Y032_0010g923 [Ancylostoma ceylanicum]|uniref:Secreted protein n=1 Tax=Ancylostoma ceylanicum TaxID=53326 RepID=A0A016VH04_9BILA|nr:hypothetical protein Y032_0010g923 [Ancylostoma ceylanicum]
MRISVVIVLVCAVATVFALPERKIGGKPPHGGHTRKPPSVRAAHAPMVMGATKHVIPEAKSPMKLPELNIEKGTGVPIVPTLGGFTDSVDLPEVQGFSSGPNLAGMGVTHRRLISKSDG